MKIRTCAVGVAALLVGATAAFADAGNPHYRSTVTAVHPAVKGLSVTVLDYDDRLQIQNQSGRTVMVEDYKGKPYLRFGADGTVEVNTNSEAYYLNDDRFGEVPVPKGLGSQPHWKVLSKTGRYDWHDHRIHWMSQDGSAAAEEQERAGRTSSTGGSRSGSASQPGADRRLAELGAAAQSTLPGRRDLGLRRSSPSAARRPCCSCAGGRTATSRRTRPSRRRRHGDPTRLALAVALAWRLRRAAGGGVGARDAGGDDAAARRASSRARRRRWSSASTRPSTRASAPSRSSTSSGREVQERQRVPSRRPRLARSPCACRAGSPTAATRRPTTSSPPTRTSSRAASRSASGAAAGAGLARRQPVEGLRARGAVTGTAFSAARAVQYGAIALGLGS